MVSVVVLFFFSYSLSFIDVWYLCRLALLLCASYSCFRDEHDSPIANLVFFAGHKPLQFKPVDWSEHLNSEMREYFFKHFLEWEVNLARDVLTFAVSESFDESQELGEAQAQAALGSESSCTVQKQLEQAGISQVDAQRSTIARVAGLDLAGSLSDVVTSHWALMRSMFPSEFWLYF